MAYQYWSVSDKVTATTMAAQGRHPREIAGVLGRTAGSVSDYLRRRDNPDRYRRPYFAPAAFNKEIPEFVIADREKRANEPRTLTMMLCGDPPFSQSALARLEGKDIRGRAENATTGGFGHSGDDGPHAMGHDRRDAEVSISR